MQTYFPIRNAIYVYMMKTKFDSLGETSFSLNIFQTLSIPNRKSQGAEILRECSSDTMCHVSCVMCHVSLIMCHMSPVTCHMSLFFYPSEKIGHSGGSSQWRVCYQWGLPRLVLKGTALSIVIKGHILAPHPSWLFLKPKTFGFRFR